MNKKIFIGLILLMASCQTSDKVSTENELKSSFRTESDDSKGSLIRSEKPEQLDSQQFLEWQKLYKANPSTKDAAQIKADLEQSPQSETFESRLQRARNLLAIGYRTEARDMYGDLLRDQPESLDALIDMAHLFLGENNLDRGFDYLNATKRILEKTERPGRAYTQRYQYALALAYLQAKNRKKSTEILVNLIEKEPRFIPGYLALSQNYLSIKKYELAEFIVKRGLDYSAEDASLLNVMGVIMLKNGQADEAKVWIDRSLRTNPEYVPSLINRAHLAMRRREYVTAENDLQKAGQLDPSSLDAQLALGILYRKTGRMSAAKLAFEKAIAIDPQSAFARYHLGSLLASEFRDTTNALQLFYDVLQAKDQDVELVNLAKARIQSIRDSRLYEKRSDKESYQ